MGVRLYVGGGGGTLPVYRIQSDGSTAREGRELDDLAGDRCFTAAHHAQRRIGIGAVNILLDSGAFTDPPT